MAGMIVAWQRDEKVPERMPFIALLRLAMSWRIKTPTRRKT
jgi:hypothetical protein